MAAQGRPQIRMRMSARRSGPQGDFQVPAHQRLGLDYTVRDPEQLSQVVADDGEGRVTGSGGLLAESHGASIGRLGPRQEGRWGCRRGQPIWSSPSRMGIGARVRAMPVTGRSRLKYVEVRK